VTAALAATFCAAATAERADPSRVNTGNELVRRLALGPIVVLARVERAGMKLDLAIEQTFRGRGLTSPLKVAYRGSNVARSVGQPRFAAEEGERAVFVLELTRDSRGNPGQSGLLRPAGGWLGKIPLPAEGADALLDAVKRVIAFQDSNSAWGSTTELVGWLTGPNPWLVDAALEQVARLGLADRETVPGLLDRSRDVRPERRVAVVDALGTALSRGRLEPQGGNTSEDDLVRAVRETLVRLARTDPDSRVRRAAVRQLAGSGIPGVRGILEAIARDDSSHDVRYEAAAATAGPVR
jgi:hypothetical protein